MSEALAELAPDPPVYVDVSGRMDAYFDLLSGLWADTRDDLVLIEHDIVIHDQVFIEFEECPLLWCAFPYVMGSGVIPGLGCTRFRHELLEETAGVWGRVARHGNPPEGQINDGMPPKHWLRNDVRLDAELMANDTGEDCAGCGVPQWGPHRNECEFRRQPHVHLPAVTHLNPKQQIQVSP